MPPSQRPLSAVRREYDQAAADYDRRWAEYVARSLALLRPYLTGRPTGRLLDLGSGTGALLPLLAEWSVSLDAYVGADASPEMLRIAAERTSSGGRRAFAAAVADALPFAGGAFDTVVTASSLHYWEDVDSSLTEIRRVLAPGGRLIVLDWSRDFVSMRLKNLAMRLARVSYERMYSEAEVTGLLRGAGFRIGRTSRAKVGGMWGVMVIEGSRYE